LAATAVLTDIPLLQDALIGAGAGLMGARLLFVAMEHGGTPVSEIHRRRLDALWLVGGAGVGCIVYMLVWLFHA
jgi:hypothetical protein